MKKFIKTISLFSLIFVVMFSLAGCGGRGKTNAEKLELAKVMIGDVEFENSKETKLKDDKGKYVVSGIIDAMSDSQKIAFGEDGATHVVAFKFTFDRERTISSFEIKGQKTKVYSDDKNTQNYAGSITELLDSEEGEDAFCYLVLSAKTKDYTLKATYSDGTEKTVGIEILATLATSIPEK